MSRDAATTATAFAAVALLAACDAQQPAPEQQPPQGAHEPVARVGDRVLAVPSAAFDPFGRLTVRGGVSAAPQGGAGTIELRFPELEPPTLGEHALGEGGLQLLVDGRAWTGTVHVEALGEARAAVRGSVRPPRAADGPEPPAQQLAIDLPAPRAPQRIEGGPAEPPQAGERDPIADPIDGTVREDLVFCALGNTGTGDAAQRRIGATLARLSAKAPFDFVLLLGDSFLPRGVQSEKDPLWRRCFEEPYPELSLPCPFHAVLGDRDALGAETAYDNYSRGSPRFRIPGFAWSFTAKSHGIDVLFVGADTTRWADTPRDPRMRFVSRTASQAIAGSTAPVKIALGHQSRHGCGPAGGASAAGAVLRERSELVFERDGVDVYLSASDHHLELVQPAKGPLEVVSGTGGGLVRGARRTDATRFAAAVPGFAWFRFDGKELTIVFRDADGAPLHVHRTKVL